jgi:beta-glucosidase
MARKAATESVVLLKNEGILPLSNKTVKKIRVVGSAATAQALKHLPQWFSADLYSGGGSGHVIPGYVVTPMDGIKARAKLAGIEVVDGSSKEEVDVTIVVGGTTTYESKDRDHLHLDDDADNLIASIAGGGPLPGVCPSGEKHFDTRGSCCCDCSWARSGTCGRDDGSCCFQCCFHLGDAAKANATLQAPPAKKPKVVVLLEIPGAVLMPWAEDVGAIAALFIGGQETGNAWASVLFGDHSPTGRLPISIPASEHDLIEPGSGTITYSEGLATGYRSQHFKHLFQFGHGLTYTNFTYSEAKVSSTTESCKQNLCVSFTLKNTGDVASAAVPQLYLEFPKAAGHPAPFLKGFSKTKALEPAEELVVTFEVSNRDLSYWQSGSWIRADSVTAHIGASSADLQLSLVVNLAAQVTEQIVV